MGVALTVVLCACSDDDGGEPGLERIDGPAQVDREILEQQTPEETIRGG